MKITLILSLALCGLAIAQNKKDKEGFMISPHGLATTNEATKKADEPRKVLVNCGYDETTNDISGCVLPEGITLTDLVREFEARDTKRVKEVRDEAIRCKEGK